jgi:hypothetical protein
VQACVLHSCDAYWLPTPFSCFPFTSPLVRHRVPSQFNWTLNALISAGNVCGIAVQIYGTVVLFAVALDSKTILGRFFVEVSRLHTDTSGETPLNDW